MTPKVPLGTNPNRPGGCVRHRATAWAAVLIAALLAGCSSAPGSTSGSGGNAGNGSTQGAAAAGKCGDPLAAVKGADAAALAAPTVRAEAAQTLSSGIKGLNLYEHQLPDKYHLKISDEAGTKIVSEAIAIGSDGWEFDGGPSGTNMWLPLGASGARAFIDTPRFSPTFGGQVTSASATGSDNVDGTPVTVYSYQADNKQGGSTVLATIKGTIAISADCLPRRAEGDMTMGASGSMHFVDTFKYGPVAISAPK